MKLIYSRYVVKILPFRSVCYFLVWIDRGFDDIDSIDSVGLGERG